MRFCKTIKSNVKLYTGHLEKIIYSKFLTNPVKLPHQSSFNNSPKALNSVSINNAVSKFFLVINL